MVSLKEECSVGFLNIHIIFENDNDCSISHIIIIYIDSTVSKLSKTHIWIDQKALLLLWWLILTPFKLPSFNTVYCISTISSPSKLLMSLFNVKKVWKYVNLHFKSRCHCAKSRFLKCILTVFCKSQFLPAFSLNFSHLIFAWRYLYKLYRARPVHCRSIEIRFNQIGKDKSLHWVCTIALNSASHLWESPIFCVFLSLVATALASPSPTALLGCIIIHLRLEFQNEKYAYWFWFQNEQITMFQYADVYIHMYLTHFFEPGRDLTYLYTRRTVYCESLQIIDWLELLQD